MLVPQTMNICYSRIGIMPVDYMHEVDGTYGASTRMDGMSRCLHHVMLVQVFFSSTCKSLLITCPHLVENVLEDSQGEHLMSSIRTTTFS